MGRLWNGLVMGTGGLCVWAPPACAGTCALCRQALASGGNPGLIQGFYWSIVLIAGIPLLMMGGVGFLAWRNSRLLRGTPRGQGRMRRLAACSEIIHPPEA